MGKILIKKNDLRTNTFLRERFSLDHDSKGWPYYVHMLQKQIQIFSQSLENKYVMLVSNKLSKTTCMSSVAVYTT